MYRCREHHNAVSSHSIWVQQGGNSINRHAWGICVGFVQEKVDGPVGQESIFGDLIHCGNRLMNGLYAAASVNNKDLPIEPTVSIIGLMIMKKR